MRSACSRRTARRTLDPLLGYPISGYRVGRSTAFQHHRALSATRTRLPTTMTKYYMLREGQRVGPLAPHELIARGLAQDTLVWAEGMDDWVPAANVEELCSVDGGLPPDAPEIAPIPVPSPHTAPSRRLRYTERQLDIKGFGWDIAALLVMLAISAIAAATGHEAGVAIAALCSLVGALLCFVITLKFCKLLWRSWGLLQGRGARTTPGMAVGLLFVPLFNLYWGFVAIHGLSQDLRRYSAAHGLPFDGSLVSYALWLAITNAVGLPLMLLLIPTPILQLIFFVAVTTRLRRQSMLVARYQAEGTWRP